ncbi:MULTISPECIES: hypothetical protein [unclassified Streptococcus]|uniref:hypothetical protein n=1 Tax=unclassified Streptococcus TaxID=2608887 RepID=UPI001071FD5D|nr:MULTISPECIES: hypothetical protein [unclassified Streptococcus]MBF0786667.1 hypothetical protein [Streptococcus sp. 19428wC2_LYSM12]MCQ9211710.1 hypothetical protein [Streptococcus sp. B01]MCQ9213101.1 hypothetical protein [Streptococcus sp. O1]TFV06419.1 hypothetical protein E4T79_01840 [Streptococcus sp. LYSM12]
MTDQQENQLHLILSDFIPLMAGDIIQGVSPEAENLTRQKVLDQLLADKELFDQDDASLVSWQEENIQLIETISDEEFQVVVDERIMLTELQIGQSLFQPLSEEHLEVLAERFKSPSGNQAQTEEKTEQRPSLLKSVLNRFS